MVSRPGNPFSGRNSNSLGGRARNSVGQDPLAMREAAQIAPIVPATNPRNTMIGDPSSKNTQAPVYAPGHGPPSSGSTSGAPPRGPPVTNPDNGLTREDNTVSTDGQSGVDVGRSEVINRPPPSTDQMYEDALRKLLESGPRDTAEEEALLREQMQRDVGSGQANLNARMAAGGMGTSGALSALGTDMRSRAAFDAANSIQGLRGDARDEWSRNVQAGLGAVNQDRTLDVNEAKFQAYIDAINGTQPTEEEAKKEKERAEYEGKLEDELEGVDVDYGGTHTDEQGRVRLNDEIPWWMRMFQGGGLARG